MNEWTNDTNSNRIEKKGKYNSNKKKPFISATPSVQVNEQKNIWTTTTAEVDFASVLIFIDAINRWEYALNSLEK